MTEQTAAVDVQTADTYTAGVTELLLPLNQMQLMMVHRTIKVSHFSHDMHAWQAAPLSSCSSKMANGSTVRLDVCC